MWVINEKGSAYNMRHAYKMDIGERYGEFKVYASFPICTGKNSSDPAFVENGILRSFNSLAAAKEYFEELVEELTDEDLVVDFADDEPAENKLDYAFTWLKKFEKLPPDLQAKFHETINNWLDMNEEEQAQPAKPKPEKFVDSVDGVPY